MLIVWIGDSRAVALRGLAALAFGIFTLAWPHLTLWALVVLFGAFVLVDGVWLIFEVIVSIAVGIITFVWPGITALALLYLIAVWALLPGTVRLAAAIQMRHAIDDCWLPALTGALSIAFAVFLAYRVRKLQHDVDGRVPGMRPATA